MFLTTAEGSHCIIGNAFLVGFDPASDFTVMPWLHQKLDRTLQLNDAIVGANNPARRFIFTANILPFTANWIALVWGYTTTLFSFKSTGLINWPKAPQNFPMSPP